MKDPAQWQILLVDDDDNLRRVVEYQLTQAGYCVTSVASGQEALAALKAGLFHLMITDVLMPGMDGLELLKRVRISQPDLGVMVITAHGDISRAVQAMQSGALDFLEKPFSGDRILMALEKSLQFVGLRDENRRLRAMVQNEASFARIIGSSPALKSLLADVKLAADSHATVLLTGESGTGKELVAKALHLNSPRKDAPFVIVNCGAIPENLVDSELFGHKRGAFTGAIRDRQGKFELAEGGTVFLDEIGELPLSLQPKLLRVLQEGEIEKLGASTPVHVDVRIVSATHQDLAARVQEGSFRQDLWYRLNVIPLRLPPLRERAEDICMLAEHFLMKHATRHGRALPRLEEGLLERLEAYAWPGNVRELENTMERLVVLSQGDSLGAADLPSSLNSVETTYGGLKIHLPARGIDLQAVERGLLEEALRRCQGNQTAAARFLGISRQTLLYRMKKFNLQA